MASFPHFYEKTLVLLKPDAVKRGLIGEIISRFERRGLKISALKMVSPAREQIEAHYFEDEAWLKTLAEKTQETFSELGIDVKEHMGTDDKLTIGRLIRGWLIDYLLEGPIVAMVIEGLHAVSIVRKIVGHTLPAKAEPGTIRGDFSIDSNSIANLTKRSVRNLIHASGNLKEAEREIKHWFSENEIYDYQRSDVEVMFKNSQK